MRFSGIVFQMAAIIGAGTYGGHILDKRYSEDFPLYTLIFSLLSVFIALFLVIRDVIKSNEKE